MLAIVGHVYMGIGKVQDFEHAVIILSLGIILGGLGFRAVRKSVGENILNHL